MSDLRIFFITHVRLLSFGILLTFASSFGQSFFISLSAGQLQTEFNLSHSDFGLLYSAATLASAAVLLWSGQLVDQHSLKSVTLYVIFGLIVGCVLMAYSTNLVLLFAALFLLRHCGQGLLGHTATTCMVRYIKRQRGLALSAVSLGFSLGEAVLPLLGVTLIAAFSWRNSWYAVAGGLLLIIPLVFLLLNKLQPVQQAEMGAEIEQKKNPAPVQAPVQMRDWTRAEVLRDTRFYLFMPALLAPGFIGTGLVIHQVYIAAEKGWSLDLLASSFISYSICQVVAAFFCGIAVDRWKATRLLGWFLLPMILATATLGLFAANYAAWVYMGLAGMSTGASITLINTLLPELYGVAHFGAIKALTESIAVFATAISPILFGWLFDAGMSVRTLALSCSGYSLLATCLTLVAMSRYCRYTIKQQVA